LSDIPNNMLSSTSTAVTSRFHIYNSLFLNLPFQDIYRTGTLLPLLQQATTEGFEKGLSPKNILDSFFRDFMPKASEEARLELLFHFIKYTERQVVLFDSVEDAAFDSVNDLNGRGTVSALLLRATTLGLQQQLKKKLRDFCVRIVLTAHPTQFYPGQVLAIINDLEPAIRQNDLDSINVLLQQLGKTAFINKEKPKPIDEAISLSWYIQNVFYETIPDIVMRLIRGLEMSPDEWDNTGLFTIGFWPGGDRDGNPFVTHDVTLEVADHLRKTVLRCYHRDIRNLRRRLTFRGVEDHIIAAEKRIYNTLHDSGDRYQTPFQLLKELEAAREVLIHDHQGLFLDKLDLFILKVRIFGFHLASMDIRQDSRKHGYAWEEMLRQLDHAPERADTAEDLLELTFDPLAMKFNDPFVSEVVDTIMSIGGVQQTNGEAGCHRYVISNCGEAIDVIRVFHLSRLILGDPLPLDIVPLFETIEDLAAAPVVMDALFRIDTYREHLKQRGNRQTIMLGFSDGTKDGGYLRANWSIFRAKEELTRVARQYDIEAIFFDGRGGPPARGGGNTHDFYASLGGTVEDKEVQVTIQGQTISSNFGKPSSCRYNLEQLLSAGVENAVFETAGQFSKKDKELLEQLAQEGYKAYLKLKRHPKFIPYLEKVTPLPYFGDSNIGSRPVKRSQGGQLTLDDLRAIPFVGSWAQMKQNVPGFYGVGSGIQRMKKLGKLKDLQSLYNRSLFFRTLMGNSMMSLTKTYYPATAYLARDKEFGPLWKRMFDEYKRSHALLLEMSGLPALMENNPSIRESIRLREWIVLPVIAIQQYALQHLRNGKGKAHETVYRKLVVRCMFGIINAARNSA